MFLQISRLFDKTLGQLQSRDSKLFQLKTQKKKKVFLKDPNLKNTSIIAIMSTTHLCQIFINVFMHKIMLIESHMNMFCIYLFHFVLNFPENIIRGIGNYCCQRAHDLNLPL